MQLNEIIAKYALRILPSETLPAIALEALSAGFDVPSMRMLAGTSTNDLEEAGNLFAKALDELKIRMPSAEEAGLTIARGIARQVLDRHVAPYQGAKRIWDEVYTRLPELQQLRPFVGLASEYEDDVPHREEYSHDIVKECEKLLDGDAANKQ